MVRRLLTALFVLATLPALGSHPRGQQPAGRPRPETSVAVVGGKLAWGKLVLGMTTKEVESVLAEGLVFRPGAGSGGCDGPEADVESQKQRLTLTFSGAAPDGRLVDIFVPFLAPRDLREVVTALKAQVPALRYQPSLSAVTPISEKDNQKPLYVLRDDPQQGVLVGPDEGLWVSRGCWS